MRRLAALVVLGLFLLVSCLSQQTQAELDASRAALVSAQAELAKAKAAGQADTTTLRAKVDATNAEVERLKTEAMKERIGSGVGTAQQTVQGVTPLLGALLPGAGGVLAILTQALGALGAAFPRKEQK
jgi:hypothetical protein